jgi:hypothetical protein
VLQQGDRQLSRCVSVRRINCVHERGKVVWHDKGHEGPWGFGHHHFLFLQSAAEPPRLGISSFRRAKLRPLAGASFEFCFLKE